MHTPNRRGPHRHRWERSVTVVRLVLLAFFAFLCVYWTSASSAVQQQKIIAYDDEVKTTTRSDLKTSPLRGHSITQKRNEQTAFKSYIGRNDRLLMQLLSGVAWRVRLWRFTSWIAEAL